jgi:hypothetical protein
VHRQAALASATNIVVLRDAAIRWAIDARKRRASPGVVPKPELDPPVELVDPDPAGSGISRSGFANGLR